MIAVIPDQLSHSNFRLSPLTPNMTPWQSKKCQYALHSAIKKLTKIIATAEAMNVNRIRPESRMLVAKILLKFESGPCYKLLKRNRGYRKGH